MVKVLNLESVDVKEKITALESLVNIADDTIIQKIISLLDDADIRVRGEAFSSLLLNNNGILHHLICSLKSENKNIRGYVALVLANRVEYEAIPHITRLADDEHPMVRSCALGALGYLRAKKSDDVILKHLTDSNMEVKKSAIKAAIDIHMPFSDDMIQNILQEKDDEVERLIDLARKNN
ncbi:MAG: HEAT repeat domain-containing protein [Thaumarchaeota archaeon]|nr:HEAT repeat domain-containing protein [Nitrososphaerota archaeon]